MCTVANIYIFSSASIGLLCSTEAFKKVNLFFEKVAIITPLEIKILWLPANKGKYEEMSHSGFHC